MIDIIETQKRWGRDICFRRAKKMSHNPVVSCDTRVSNLTQEIISLIEDMKPGVLNKDGACFWKYLTWVKALPVVRVCDICGEIKILPNIKFGIPNVCKKCSGIKTSATRQGISLSEWNEYATEQVYCHKFNQECRTHNRDKYDNRCFLCGKPQSKNITTTGKQLALSVHHIDRNKDQGCNDHDWNLVPLCMEHHGGAHTDVWQSRIEYLLDNVWN